MATESGHLLDIRGLHTNIQLSSSVVRAVDGIDLWIDRGETLGLVGESGCGKSMTGLSIMRLLPPGGHIAEGSISFGGKDLATATDSELRRIRGNDIGMVFQDSSTSLNPTMTIGDQVTEPIRLHLGLNKVQSRERAAEMLNLAGVPQPAERLDEYPHRLSGGLRQRVLIAMALACEPKLLIADEPTTALDVTIQAQILEVLDRLKAELGLAVLLITHDMGVVAGRADRINVMYGGRMVETSDTSGLFRRMRHPYTQALLASIPLLTQDTNQPLYSIQGVPPDLTREQTGCRFAARCAKVQPDCTQTEPALTEESPGRAHRCFHPVDGPMPVAQAPDEVTTVVAKQREPLLTISNAVREFGIGSGFLPWAKLTLKAVSDVSITVGRGETFGLVGESGCGKTTLGRLMVALERPDSGTISLAGEDIGGLRPRQLRHRRRDLQMMFQDPFASLDPRMRVGAILAEPLQIQGVGDRASQRKAVAEMLDEVGLPVAAVDRFPHEFSGGQRQRIGLARALILKPALIVADEPVSALDVSIRSQVLNLMKRLQREHELTYVVISHDLAVVKYLADRIGVMYLGKLVEQGSGDDIYRRPAHPYTAGLIATIAVPDPEIERGKTRAVVAGELPSPIAPPSGCRFRTRCPRAAEICADVEPALREFSPGHIAACHFPLIPITPSLTD